MTEQDARLQAILDLAADGLIIVDEDGTITDINAAAARRVDDFAPVAAEWFWETDAENRIVFLSERYFHDTGQVPQTVLGRYPWDIGFVIEDAEIARQVVAALRNHDDLPNCVVRRTLPDGGRQYFRLAGMPRFLPDGIFAGYRGTGHDVSALERRNRELAEMNAVLDQHVTKLRLLNETLESQGGELARLAETAEAARQKLEAEIAERQKLERRLRELAMTDALTGAANRRAFLATANRELARAARHRRPLALIAIDIDHFKSINDRYGHAAGDVVLCAVAGLCLEQVRAADNFGRLGGEEFAALLPETTHDAAVLTAERLRAAVAALQVPVAGETIAVTASFGVATLQPADTDFAALMRRADAALYEAKDRGRNRVVADTPAGPRIVAG